MSTVTRTQRPESARRPRHGREDAPSAETATPQQRSWPRRVARWALTFAAIAVGLVALAALVVPRIIGAVPLAVLTGSMNPAIHPGDLIVTQPTDIDNIRVGDVITFQPNSADPMLITHRVVEKSVVGGEAQLVTRGDANGANDEPIVADQVKGKVLYSLPYVGYATQAVPNDLRAWAVPAVGVVLIGYAAVTLTLSFRRTRQERAQQEELS
ncbi:signal peptidase I [Lysinibacter cavernae]|uniref:Signal peptidase I n=1 Tax=Lysinibacter cavernae TaxID=1640652 RepID=A0A7X5R1P2_9MICO|nr:signal peptidase I [Lysinibacter cavernae]NIH53892.1 signal peptidase [Lysinibacter cavernae]